MYLSLINTYDYFCRHFSWKKTTGGSAYWASTGVCLSRFLCMHKILVHAQHSCACTPLLCMHWRGPRPGPKTSAGPGPDPRRFFWVLALGPGPSSACTRVLCMHKSVVHAQDSCACTRILISLTRISTFLGTSFPLMHNTPFVCFHTNKYCSETFLPQRSDFLVYLHLHSRLRRIQ